VHPFTPGDLVICIDDTPQPDRIVRVGEPWVKAGRAYRIQSTSTNEVGEHGVELQQVQHWPPRRGVACLAVQKDRSC
jgi:hypothetical protein